MYLWVTPVWESYTEEGDTGLYADLINAIATIENIQLDKKIHLGNDN